MGRTTADRQRKELVVFRVSTGGYFSINLDPAGRLDESVETHFNILVVKITT